MDEFDKRVDGIVNDILATITFDGIDADKLDLVKDAARDRIRKEVVATAGGLIKNTIAIETERDALLAQQAADVDAVHKLIANQKLVDEAWEARKAELDADFVKELEAREAEVAQLDALNAELEIAVGRAEREDKLTGLATRLKVRPEAMEDVYTRAKAEGVQIDACETWLRQNIAKNPHWKVPSQGTVAPGGRQSAADVVLTAAEASDHQRYMAAQEQAAQNGGKIVIAG